MIAICKTIHSAVEVLLAVFVFLIFKELDKISFWNKTKDLKGLKIIECLKLLRRYIRIVGFLRLITDFIVSPKKEHPVAQFFLRKLFVLLFNPKSNF